MSDKSFLNRKWFLFADNTQTGPMTTEEIKEGLKSGQMDWVDFVYSPGFVMTWTRVCEVDGFKKLMPPVPILSPIINSMSNLQMDFEGEGSDLSKGISDEKRKTRIWYIQFAGREFGPYEFHEFKDLYLTGKLTGSVFLWRKGLESWVAIEDTLEFKDLVDLKRDRKKFKEKEQRRVARFPLLATLTFRGSDSDTLGVCSDISSKGIKILSNQMPESLGMDLNFVLNPHVSTGLIPMAIGGKVVSIAEDQRSFAIEFINLSRSSELAIEKYLLAQKVRAEEDE